MKLLKNLPLILLLALLLPPSVEAQSVKAYMKKAQEAYNARNYSTALAHYRTILQEEPKRLDVLYFAAESARHLRSYKLAERYYEDIPDIEKRGLYELTDFWLATVKKGMEKFDEASVLFAQFAEGHPNNVKHYRKALEEIKNCDWALDMVQNPLRVEINQLSENVNSYYADYAPFLVGDTLYYTSSAKVRVEKKKKSNKKTKKKRKKRKRKKKKKKTNSRTQYMLVSKIFKAIGENKGKPIRQNSRKSNTYTANMTMNTTRTRMYYSVCEVATDGSIDCSLYYRDRSYSGSWERARLLPQTINVEGYKTTQPAVGIDARTGKEVLFFSSDRIGGEGMMDIWYCFVEGPETFSTPQNLISVNSPDDEMSPFFDSHAQALYFSSDGYQNIGGYDLYKTVKKDDKWSEPENLGYPINSSYDEMYYSFDTESGRVFIASNRPGSLCASESKDCNLYDIYELVPNMSVLVSVFNEENFALQKGATLRWVNKLTGAEEMIAMKAEEYYATIALSPGQDYDLIVTKEGFQETTTLVSSKNFSDDSEAKKYVFLTPLEGYVSTEPPVSKEDIPPPTKSTQKYSPPVPQNPEEIITEKNTLEETLTENTNGEALAEVEVPQNVVKEEVILQKKKTNYPPKNKTNYPPKRKTNYPPKRKTNYPPEKTTLADKPQTKNTESSKRYSAVLVGTRSGFDVAIGDFATKYTPKPKPRKAPNAPEKNVVDEKVYSLNLPITIYFDNNYPRTNAPMKTLTYKTAYKTYMARKSTYLSRYPAGQKGIEIEFAKRDVNNFFSRELQYGYLELMEFTENLLHHLRQGAEVELSIEGYGSPLGNAAYNALLTDRRIQTILNHFELYSNGVLSKYIGKQLIIKKVPFGESRSSSKVSDDYTDKRSSVYSPRACMERRVTINGYKKSNSGQSSSK